MNWWVRMHLLGLRKFISEHANDVDVHDASFETIAGEQQASTWSDKQEPLSSVAFAQYFWCCSRIGSGWCTYLGISALTLSASMAARTSHRACCTWLLRTGATCFRGCACRRKSVDAFSCRKHHTATTPAMMFASGECNACHIDVIPMLQHG